MSSAENRQVYLLIAAALVILGFFVRFNAALDGFWADEILSFHYAGSVDTPLSIFSGPSYDNNHPLNTLWMWIFQDQANWLIHRSLSILSGVAMLGLLWFWRKDEEQFPVTALIAMALCAFNFLLVTYTSEARGYGPMLFFLTSAFLTMDRVFDSENAYWKRDGLIHGVSIVLGFVSHLAFSHFYLGALSFTALTIFFHRENAGKLIARAALIHGPVIFFLGLYWYFRVRVMNIAGGPVYSPFEVIPQAFGAIYGLRYQDQWNWDGLLMGLVFLSGGLWMLLREGNPARAGFYLVTIIFAPLTLLFAMEHNILYLRYFLVNLLFLLLLTAELLGFLWRTRSHRPWVGAFAAVYLILNAIHLQQLLTVGRGDYLNALVYMEENTTQPGIAISTDHPLRNGEILGFYSRYLSESRRIIYYPWIGEAERWEGQPPKWVILHQEWRYAEEPAPIIEVGGFDFELAYRAPYYGESGFEWLIYDLVGEDDGESDET